MTTTQRNSDLLWATTVGQGGLEERETTTLREEPLEIIRSSVVVSKNSRARPLPTVIFGTPVPSMASDLRDIASQIGQGRHLKDQVWPPAQLLIPSAFLFLTKKVLLGGVWHGSEGVAQFHLNDLAKNQRQCKLTLKLNLTLF